MKIYIGADHRGFALKEDVKRWLQDQGYDVMDCGNTVYDKDDDYTDYSFAVAEHVAADASNHSCGILVCGSSIGVTIAANKVKGIRCGAVFSPEAAKHGRNNDDMNVLALAGEHLSLVEAQEIVTAFLEAPFSGLERYVRRREKIAAYEHKNKV